MIANGPIESFPPEVRHRLGCYVYRPIDLRNGDTLPGEGLAPTRDRAAFPEPIKKYIVS